jgi:LysM repeat protein
LFGGIISDNTAEHGGGIYNDVWTIVHSSYVYGGVISNNMAVDGGGIYIAADFVSDNGVYFAPIVELFSGIISGNTASNDGGGIWIALGNLDLLYVFNGMVFSDNSALIAYDRDPIYDELYRTHISADVVWTDPFTQGYNNYDISCQKSAPLLYTVQSGDSLWFIARTYKTTIEDLKALNGLTSDTIYYGQQFLIPQSPNIYVVEPGDILESIAEKCNTTVHTIKVLNNLIDGRVYVGQKLQVWYWVQPGDSLWYIAQTYGTTIEDLKALDGLTGDTIYPGQSFLIPYPGQSFLIRQYSNIYVVEVDDTLESIAQKCDTTEHTLRVLNNLADDSIFVGQELQFRYIVKTGDSLWSIAWSYHTALEDLKALNGITGDMVYVGMLLVISE